MDIDAVNGALAGMGLIATVEIDGSVAGQVVIETIPRLDDAGVQMADENGLLFDEVHTHVALDAPAMVVVVRNGDGTEHRFSTGYDEEELLLVLDDMAAEADVVAAHERGEHAEHRDTRCQPCWEAKYAADAADARHQALYAGRDRAKIGEIAERLGR